MFKTVKEKVQICDVVSKYTDESIKMIGESATVESDVCPFCQHKDCFRMKLEGDDKDGFYHCFSCGEHGDSIKFVQSLKGFDSPVDAVKLIAKDFNITLPSNSNPIQEIFTLAARYYKTCFDDTNEKIPELGGMTPKEYQIKTRGHTEKTIETLQIGWSDGGLVIFLQGIGTDMSLLESSGLINKVGKDFLPQKVFIYPHYVNGKVSHFTFKDPLKKLAYQLKSSCKINGHQWYNQDAISVSDTVILVEGENDLASIIDFGSRNVMASIGSLAASQIEWLIDNHGGKNLITLFDPDSAGDKYREKIHKARHKFGRVVQIIPANGKDIDELLRDGGNLKDIISNGTQYNPETVSRSNDDSQEITLPSASSDEREASDDENEKLSKDDDSSIAEDKGCYWRITWKEGVAKLTKITNFTLKLQNVFLEGNKRNREVVLIRCDGRRFGPRQVSSETKTSVKSFKTFAAEAGDCSFTGSEMDLAAIWERVFKNSEEKEVHIIDHVGLTEYGWIFNDKMITASGKLIEADKDGVFWANTVGTRGSVGVKPVSIESSEKYNRRHMPNVITSMPHEEVNELLLGFVENLANNLGHPGRALLMIGWLRAVAFSEWFYDMQEQFPHIWMAGKSSAGKTTIIGWMLSTYGMETKGVFNLGTMKTPVAAERKIAYYSSLPICIDEMRNDHTLKQYESTFRGWYNRQGRDIGTNEDSVSIKKLPIRACAFYAGQDMTTDPAMMERLILIDIMDQRIAANNRETTATYKWISSRSHLLPALGNKWIQESIDLDKNELAKKVHECCERVMSNDVKHRFGINYALMKVMADEYAQELFPEFKWEEYIIQMAKRSQNDADREDVVAKYFEIAETLTMGRNPAIDADYFRIEDNYLLLHFVGVFNKVVEEMNRLRSSEAFSQNTVRKRFEEQGWYVKTERKRFGLKNEQKRIMFIDLDKAPEYIRTFAKYDKEGN